MKRGPRTIRAQIVTAFAACFAFMAVTIAANYVNFQRLARSMRVFELAEELKSTIQEMRRYEKNYFLYRQNYNYEENLTYSNKLELILQRERETTISSLGTRNYERFLQDAHEYAEWMEELHKADCALDPCDELEAQIRGTGQNLLILADQLVDTERRAIDRRLEQLIPMPLLSLAVLIALMGGVVFFVGENVVRPLARITRESEAVASGLFERINPFGSEGNEIHSLVTTINRMVGELEKRQEQLVQSRKIASIGTLTAGIAHEINNPLNNISLILESMLEDAHEMEPEECKRLLRDAVDQTDRASEIVRNLLEFSRVSRPRFETFNLDELVDKTSRLVNNELNLNQITFHKEVRKKAPTLRLDKGGLQQVLLNLFMNAIQAMEAGGNLSVVIDRVESTGEVRVDVIDDGPGIPGDHLDRIFDPFFTTKKEGVGTGLGLSVSYSIVAKNGGRMEVKSEVGEGTCFSVYLPPPDAVISF